MRGRTSIADRTDNRFSDRAAVGLVLCSRQVTPTVHASFFCAQSWGLESQKADLPWKLKLFVSIVRFLAEVRTPLRIRVQGSSAMRREAEITLAWSPVAVNDP